ncbi:MAG: hypothetical protein FJW37_07895 [Acidobacteria bacterium]|nr:hypothetical protein [Acidobacteriota bacterium]
MIDPATGQPVGMGSAMPLTSIPGLSGLPPAHAVGEDYQLRPFEYFRNVNGQRYVQNALSNPYETPGYQPPNALPAPVLPPPSPPPEMLPPAVMPQTGGVDPNPSALPPPASSPAVMSSNWQQGQRRNRGGWGFSGFGGFNPFAFAGMAGLPRPYGMPGRNGASQYDPNTGAASRDLMMSAVMPRTGGGEPMMSTPDRMPAQPPPFSWGSSFGFFRPSTYQSPFKAGIPQPR